MKSIAFLTLALSLLSALLTGCAATPATTATAVPSATATAAPSATATNTLVPTETPVATVTPYSGPLTIQYLGNSCILVMAPDGTRIVSDPYGAFTQPTGMDSLPKNLEANAVTVSHTHPDHNATGAVGGSPQVIKFPGDYQIGMVKITGYKGYEGSPTGPSKKSNTIFVFEVDGARIVQLGDSGPVTDPDVLAGIDNADLIIVNIDNYVIPLDKMMPFLQQIHAHTIVPAHYDIPSNGSTSLLDGFLKILPPDMVVVKEDSEIQITPDMPRQVVVLTPLTLTK